MRHTRAMRAAGLRAGFPRQLANIGRMHYVNRVATNSPAAQNKKEMTRALLLRGSVFLHVDPRKQGVEVPQWLQDQPQVVLQIGLDMPVPIPDLRVTSAGVKATLSFNRAPHACMIPWDAVFAVVGDEGTGMVWREDLPEELALELEREQHRRGPDPKPSKVRSTGPKASASPRGSLASVAKLSDRSEGVSSSSDGPASVGGRARPTPLRNSAPSSSTDTPSGRGSNSGRTKLPPYLRVIK
jgi:stringent starvation protein B